MWVQPDPLTTWHRSLAAIRALVEVFEWTDVPGPYSAPIIYTRFVKIYLDCPVVHELATNRTNIIGRVVVTSHGCVSTPAYLWVPTVDGHAAMTNVGSAGLGLTEDFAVGFSHGACLLATGSGSPVAINASNYQGRSEHRAKAKSQRTTGDPVLHIRTYWDAVDRRRGNRTP